MASIGYSSKVFAPLKQKLRSDILNAPTQMPELKKEIARVFQIANRRIQNIEKSGLYSPAVQALNKSDVTGFSKFSVGGKSWYELKNEYGKAIEFLNKPTSTATGTREYARHIEQSYNLEKGDYKLVSDKLLGKLMSIEDNDYVERYLFRYKDFTGELEALAQDIAPQLEQAGIEADEQLINEIQQEATDVLNSEEIKQHRNNIPDILDLTDLDGNGIKV